MEILKKENKKLDLLQFLYLYVINEIETHSYLTIALR